MKKGVLIICIVLSVLVGCDKTEKIVYESEQYVVGYISDQSYNNKIDSWGISGTLTAYPLPDFEYIKLNGEFYYGDDYYSELPGVALFGISEYEMINPIDDVVNLEIKTSYGAINCFINKPASIESIVINGQEYLCNKDPVIQILRGEELYVSWIYGVEKPDFIWIQGDYDWYEGTHNCRHFEKVIPNVASEVMLFQEGEIDKLGYINFFIIPTNGPLIGSEQEGNVTGDGCGYVWWFNDNPGNWFEIQVVDSLG